MTRYDKYIREAISIAQMSNMTHKLGAIIIKSGKIVGKGFNISNRTRILKHDNISIHAEINAIYNYLKSKKIFTLKTDLSDVQLLVIRYANGRCASSKPCTLCLKVIRSLGIKKIHYANDNGILESTSPNYISGKYTKSILRINII